MVLSLGPCFIAEHAVQALGGAWMVHIEDAAGKGINPATSSYHCLQPPLDSPRAASTPNCETDLPQRLIRSPFRPKKGQLLAYRHTAVSMWARVGFRRGPDSGSTDLP